MSDLLCPRCGTLVSSGKTHCPNCGEFLEPERPEEPQPLLVEEPQPVAPSRACPFCAYASPTNAHFCPNCGKDLSISAAEETPEPLEPPFLPVEVETKEPAVAAEVVAESEEGAEIFELTESEGSEAEGPSPLADEMIIPRGETGGESSLPSEPEAVGQVSPVQGIPAALPVPAFIPETVNRPATAALRKKRNAIQTLIALGGILICVGMLLGCVLIIRSIVEKKIFLAITRTTPVSSVISGIITQNQLDDVSSTPSRPATGTQPSSFPSLTPTTTPIPTPRPIMVAAALQTAAVSRSEPSGRIVYTCEVKRDPDHDQICLINANGSGHRQLTNYTNGGSFYASWAPDGDHIVFSSSVSGTHEIYEMNLKNENTTPVKHIEMAYAPEISPDGRFIVFTYGKDVYSSIWLMDRDGGHLKLLYSDNGNDVVDPTWSPDGKFILFAVGSGDYKRLYRIRPDGDDLAPVTELMTRGRSDWTANGLMAAYSGGSWKHEIYLWTLDDPIPYRITNGGNNLAPSFSPDGNWIAFTSYMDEPGNDNGCEIYIMRVDGTDIRRLTNESYCSYQPRWGP